MHDQLFPAVLLWAMHTQELASFVSLSQLKKFLDDDWRNSAIIFVCECSRPDNFLNLKKKMTIEPCFYATGAQTVRRWKWLGRLHQKNGLEHKTPKVRTLLVLRCDHRYGRANLRPAYYWSSTWPPLKTLACMWGAKEIATVLCAGLAFRVAIVRAAAGVCEFVSAFSSMFLFL